MMPFNQISGVAAGHAVQPLCRFESQVRRGLFIGR